MHIHGGLLFLSALHVDLSSGPLTLSALHVDLSSGPLTLSACGSSVVET